MSFVWADYLTLAERLSNNRRKADYDNNLNTSANTLAQLTIGMAKSVLENLDSL